MIHLLNGNKHARLKSSEGVDVLACGCASTERQWIQMCDEHYQEWWQRHEDDRRRQDADEPWELE